MSKRSRTSVEEKLEAVMYYHNEHKSTSWLAKKYQVTDSTIKDWIRKYNQ
ncbi:MULTISPECIES: helix-turn-helix domain-containing protein [unclassified Streptococcus]|nr:MULTISPECIES: helix-turn-helix domain-containing protein [unclassified Streptococcus]MBF0806678.1 helix-turn-helix domain-containing protein [Streptococcus sp. 19428wA2_WM07]TFU26689.1 helix-turn-helix domain-containing protein [Streptococcus sp. WM07]